MRKIFTLPLSRSQEDKKLIAVIKTIVGFTPTNLSLYKLAILHSSQSKETAGFRESNERLEYLGDAILGAAVADYLFKKHPLKGEGFMTEIRSQIVNRKSLNNLAHKLGIDSIAIYDRKNTHLKHSVLGNTLEALIGAIHLDKGYLQTKKFIIDRLIQSYLNTPITKPVSNHKSRLIEWAQQQGRVVKFKLIEEENSASNPREFCIQVIIGTDELGIGYGMNKKTAEQNAAEKTCAMLDI